MEKRIRVIYTLVKREKMKKMKKPRHCEGCNEGQPPVPFDKGDLYNALDFYCRNKGLENTRRCDMVIDIPIVFLPLCGFPLKSL